MIIGHQKIINLLDKSVEKNAMVSAYLFLGPESVGKFAVAEYFAKKFAKGADLKIIRPEIEEKKGITKKLDIKIEEIRKLLHWLALSTQENKYRVAIIDDADFMTKSAQNAILKKMEEPNKRTVLILISQDENKIISTIHSRCRKIKFGIVTDEELKENLTDGEDKEEAIFWSFGRPGIALRLISNKDEMKFMLETSEELRALFSKSVAEKFSLAEKLSKNEALLIRKMNLWVMILRKKILDDSSVGLINKQKILSLIEKIAEDTALIRGTNSNSRLILENLFLNF